MKCLAEGTESKKAHSKFVHGSKIEVILENSLEKESSKANNRIHTLILHAMVVFPFSENIKM